MPTRATNPSVPPTAKRPLSPLETRLRALRDRGRAGLVPFVTAGHPAPGTLASVLGALERAGAVAAEVGIPFSDPLADGPAIQRSSQAALDAGMTLERTLDEVRSFHAESELPLVLMSYLNPVLAYGAGRFAAEAREAGVSGVILTDLPPEERPDVWRAVDEAGLDAVILIAPTTLEERRRRLASRARGFVYCVSRTGVTGEPRAFARELESDVRTVREASDVPVGVGFGVSDEERARRVAAFADAVIVGAAFCEHLEAGRRGDVGVALEEVERFAGRLAAAVASVEKPAADPPKVG